MRQPPRMREARSGTDLELQAVLNYAREQAPSQARIADLTARVLRELSVPSAADGCVVTLPKAATASLPHSPVARLATGIAVLVTVAGIVLTWAASRTLRSVQPRRPVVTHALPAASPAMPVRKPEPVPVQQLGVAPQHLEQPAEVRMRRRVAAVATRHPPSPAVSIVSSQADPAAEIRLLHRARRMVATKPEAALSLAEEHQRQFPTGTFCEEREALAIEALWRLGSADRAAARLRELLERFPSSAYRERLTAQLSAAP